MIPVLYEDESVIVVDKPAGLASQPGEAVAVSLVELVERETGSRVFPVHRLDRETAGCMLLARSSVAARAWGRVVELRQVSRTYRALCSGSPSPRSGTIRLPIRERGVESPAVTGYSLVAGFGSERRFSLVEFSLGTGRTHQIRIHAAGAGFPVLGDDRHGDFPLNRELRRSYGLRKLTLWAMSLRLPSGILVRAAVPGHFLAFLSRFPDAPDPAAAAR